jgi:hypothetical protein
MMPYHRNMKGWMKLENRRFEIAENLFTVAEKVFPHQKITSPKKARQLLPAPFTLLAQERVTIDRNLQSGP